MLLRKVVLLAEVIEAVIFGSGGVTCEQEGFLFVVDLLDPERFFRGVTPPLHPHCYPLA
jgi:hypothetical protein